MNVKSDFYYMVYEFLDALWRRRYLFCVTVAIIPVCALIVGVMMPKKYEATTSILVYESALLNPFLKDLAYSTELKKRITGLNVFINSPKVLEEVAIASNIINENSNPQAIEKVTESLAKSLSIKMLGSNVVSIKLTSNQPTDMVTVLTQVRNMFVARLLAPRTSSIKSSEEFLNQQIVKQSRKLSQAEEDYAIFKKNNAENLPSNSKLYSDQLQKVLIKINENATLLAGAQAELSTIRNNLVNANPLLGHLELELITTKADYEKLRVKYTEEHSKIKKLKRKIRALEEQKNQVVNEIKRLSNKGVKQYWNIALVSSTSSEQSKYQPLLVEQLQNLQRASSKVERIQNETAILKKQVIMIRNKIAGISLFEKRLNELKREVEVNQELYQKLKKRLVMASVTGDLGKFEQNNLVKVIELPQIPTKPTNKPLILFLIAGIVGGIMMGIGLVIVIEFLDGTVRQARVIENYTGVPVLCRIPRTILN